MPTNPSETRPLAIIGPSGCGKSSVLERLMARGLVHITPTWTDRPRRAGETELEHRFVSVAEFSAQVTRGAFAEVVRAFGLPFRYGLPLLEQADGRAPVAMIRAPFVAKFLTYYPLAVVYQIEADFEFAKAAVLARAAKGHGTRLEDFEAEISTGRKLADRLFHNDGGDLEILADAIEAALRQDELA